MQRARSEWNRMSPSHFGQGTCRRADRPDWGDVQNQGRPDMDRVVHQDQHAAMTDVERQGNPMADTGVVVPRAIDIQQHFVWHTSDDRRPVASGFNIAAAFVPFQ